MMGAADINGFVVEACDMVPRGVADDTVDIDRFEQSVEEKLLPVLGSYVNGEPHSIVVLDNASVRHSDYVVELIEGAGAKVIYTAPYSPYLNPIELMFNQYKMALKRCAYSVGWIDAHYYGLASVSPANARNYFRYPSE
jgi:hypothetical protein